MRARFIVADVFDGLATLEDESVDLVVTSPPFLALRSYLPADHPDKGKEIGSEKTPAEYIDTLLAVTTDLRRVLAPHGSIAIELGDTYAGSGGAGGDYAEHGMRAGQPAFDGSGRTEVGSRFGADPKDPGRSSRGTGGVGWPLAKSRTLIPQLYEIALAYGFNPLTGQESPAGQWRIRNVVTWARPNPPVGALGDKWRPATSDVIVACLSGKRYWDDLATRRAPLHGWTSRLANGETGRLPTKGVNTDRADGGAGNFDTHTAGAPLLDYWEITTGGYPGSHYAVFPPALVDPLVKAMCPERVCRTCGEPSRRIESREPVNLAGGTRDGEHHAKNGGSSVPGWHNYATKIETIGFTDCGHDDYRPGIVLDPFAGSGTTLAVATGHGHDAIGIDIDERNADLATERVGPLLMEIT